MDAVPLPCEWQDLGRWSSGEPACRSTGHWRRCVQFQDASALWGMRSSYTVGSVLRSRASGSGLRSIIRIGRAGEKLVSYACVITETYRHFGRLGLGAVMGSKN